MISVEEATGRILAAFKPVESENVALADADGRTLAADAHAKIDQPPFPLSAMDGYAVRSGDQGPRSVVGSAPAGHPFAGKLGQGEAVRLFTGSVVPEGGDAVLAQEDAHIEDCLVYFETAPRPGRYIRAQGFDFRAGAMLARAGQCLAPRDLALLAAGDVTEVEVRRKPVVAFAATGDELSRLGEARKPGGVVASSVYGLSALIRRWGGEPRDLGIIPDEARAIAPLTDVPCDLLMTLGGASVGDHDLVRSALGPEGLSIDFWKIAMRPGKPLIFGRIGARPFLGLPGNPVSTLVCALLFLRPAIMAMLGRETGTALRPARLEGSLRANDTRQDYVRAACAWRDGHLWARPFPEQDSSGLRIFSQADALIVRRPQAPALSEGADIEILPLD
jgi:molybdopterin molybdotransferase